MIGTPSAKARAHGRIKVVVAPMRRSRQEIRLRSAVDNVFRDWPGIKADEPVLQIYARVGVEKMLAAEIKKQLNGLDDDDAADDAAEDTPDGAAKGMASQSAPSEGAPSERVTRHQLDLFPLAEQDIVERIGRAYVFVPSRDAYVCIDPETITADELQEAGQYLLEKGARAIARGNAVIELWRMRKGDRAGGRRRKPAPRSPRGGPQPDAPMVPA